jgi:hypothetical protein
MTSGNTGRVVVVGWTERNGFISPDFVKSFTSELLDTERSMSLFEVNVILLI